MLVLDFVNAFFLLPLRREEYRYFVAAFRGSFFVWLRVAQGSKNGPQLFGRASAQATRFTASLAPSSHLRQQTYTDDPWLAIRGTKKYVDELTATVILMWLALGFPLAFDKGQRGQHITWVGHDIAIDTIAMKVTASIKAEFMRELATTTKQLMAKNVCSLKEIRSFAGAVNHVASLLWGWRPFLEELWAAISAPKQATMPAANTTSSTKRGGRRKKKAKDKRVRSGAPPNCIWKTQIIQTLLWIDTFLAGDMGLLSRTWSLDQYIAVAADLTFSFDASPWGIGGVLVHKGRIVVGSWTP